MWEDEERVGPMRFPVSPYRMGEDDDLHQPTDRGSFMSAGVL